MIKINLNPRRETNCSVGMDTVIRKLCQGSCQMKKIADRLIEKSYLKMKICNPNSPLIGLGS